ncbi:glycosyltransferase [Maridesulfovibrio sp.]|uniref:glycosyltransferase family 2 protein n=1 Tax=Maridesulfovibrio sp. TaxID=2795000 RepID=UPI002AA8C652|nr:glycosyltransferase [Maridesulfovibrio sp.]
MIDQTANKENILKSRLAEINWTDRFNSYNNAISGIKQLESQSQKLPQASVVIVASKNFSPEIVGKLKQEAPATEIILVSESTQAEQAEKPEADTKITLHAGFTDGMARNIGAVFCKAPLLIFLDGEAVPAANFTSAHLEEHSRYQAIMIRGTCLPKTKSPLNSKAEHYFLGDKTFPHFCDLEENMSINAESFFQVDGWDEHIKYGHDGIDLSYRLLQKFPNPQQLLYSPLPVIRNDYVESEEELVNKQHRMAVSWRYLQSKHAGMDHFIPRWEREWSKLPPVDKESQETLVPAGNFTSANGPRKVDNPEYESMLRLAKRYKDSGNMEKARQYEERARKIEQAAPPAEHPSVMQEETALPTDGQLLALADLLMLGEYEQVLAFRHVGHPQLISMQSAAAMRMGNLELAATLIERIEDSNERRLKRKALTLLPKLAEPLSGNPRVHLIILCHNREKELTQAFRELAKTKYENYAVYIADNGSTDRTWERLQEAVKLFPPHIPVEIERLPTNIGRPAGHNWLLTKYDHSKSDFIAIGDDDLVSVPENWLIDMLKTAELFPNAAAVGGKSLDPGLPPVIHAGVRNIVKFEAYELGMTNSAPALDLGQFDFIDLVDHVIGCLHIYKSELFLDKVGLFDISLSPCQCVDIEHHLRAKTLGYDIVFNGFIQFQHMRAMGKSVSKNKALSGNSLGNVVKILAKYDQEQVADVLSKDRAKREEWLDEE